MAKKRSTRTREEQLALAAKNGTEASRLNRPTRRKRTRSESEARALCVKIGRRLSLELMQEIDARTRETRWYTEEIRKELEQPKPRIRRMADLRRGRMTNRDVVDFNNSVQDRFGQKKGLEIEGKGFAPTHVIFIEGGAATEG